MENMCLIYIYLVATDFGILNKAIDLKDFYIYVLDIIIIKDCSKLYNLPYTYLYLR